MKGKLVITATAIAISLMYAIKRYLKHQTLIKSNEENKRSEIEITKFDLSSFKAGDNVLLVGKKCTGKTTMIGKILDSLEGYIPGIVVSPADTYEMFYDKKYIMYESCIYNKYSPEIITKFIKGQIDNIISDFTDEKKCFAVLDNCLLHTDTDKNLTDLLVNGYFYKTINILAVPSLYNYDKDLKTKMDYVFVFNDSHILSRQKTYTEYFEPMITYSEFDRLMTKYTQDYQCLIIDYNNGGKIYHS